MEHTSAPAKKQAEREPFCEYLPQISLFPEKEWGKTLDFEQKKVVHPAGLEPTTYCSGGSRL